MRKTKSAAHPYHYSVDKNIIQHFLDWGVPIGLFLVYFQLYNLGKFTPSEMVKTTGLLSLSLLSLTLFVGPLARLIPALDILKAHRKFWGITSFLLALTHVVLVFIFYFKFNLFKFIDLASPRSLSINTGILAMLFLLLVTLTSNPKALKNLNPKTWKAIQLTSYLALILALTHFYLLRQVDGTLIFKGLLGQLTFGFALIALILRLIIFFLPRTGK